MPVAKWVRRRFWALFLFMCVANALGIFAPLDRDEGAFLVIAQEILHGHIPYRDVFDHKSPGVYYLLAGLLLLTRPLSVTGQILILRLVAVATNALSGIGLMRLGRRWWQDEVGRMAALFWLAISAVRLFGANLLFTEPFASAAVIWAFVRLTRRNDLRAALEAGLLLAAGSLFKQTAILALPSFALVLWMESAPHHGERGRRSLISIAVLLAGFSAPWLALCGLFALAGGLAPFINQVVLVNLTAYPASGNDAPFLLFLLLTLLLIYIGPALLLIGQAFWRTSDHCGLWGRPERKLVILALLIVLETLPMIAHPYPHYLIQVLPWLALFLAVAIADTGIANHHQQSPLGFLARLGAAAYPILIALPLITSLTLALSAAPSGWRTLSTQIADGEWIAAETAPHSRVLIAPAEPEYYYLSGRLPITPYVYLLPVNHAAFPLARVTDDILARRFDVVVWCPHTVQADSPQQYADMLAALKRSYRMAPDGDHSIIIFQR